MFYIGLHMHVLQMLSIVYPFLFSPVFWPIVLYVMVFLQAIKSWEFAFCLLFSSLFSVIFPRTCSFMHFFIQLILVIFNKTPFQIYMLSSKLKSNGHCLPFKYIMCTLLVPIFSKTNLHLIGYVVKHDSYIHMPGSFLGT